MNIEKLKESIKRFEGLELKPYYCPNNKLSIGYGRNLEDRGISKNEADYLLNNDILNIKLELEDKLPIFKKLDDVRRNVLLEMAFNMGVPKLLGFKKTIQYLKNGDYLEASKEMLNSKWHEDFKKYAPNTKEELLRSSILSKLMREGKFND